MRKKIENSTKEEIFKMIKIILGNLILGFSYSKWMVPRKIINGGVTSLAMVFSKLIGVNVVILTNVFTLLLLLICLLFLGKKMLVRSLLGSVSYMLFFTFFSKTSFSILICLPLDLLLACLLISLGYFLCISAESSTVGLDVIALILVKRRPNWSVAKIIRNLNFLVLLLGLLVYGSFSIAIGILFSFIYSWLLDKMLLMEKEMKTKNE